MSDETTTLGGRAQRWLQRAVAFPYVWLLLFFLTPFLIILKISVAEPLVAQPPFTPLFEWGQRGIEGIRLTFENYAFLFQDGYYGIIYLSSLKMAAIGTLLCLLIGYPMAYYIARQPARRRQVLLLAVILPFWILPLYANLERLDIDLLDAAADLGARRWQAFIDVTLPLSVPGIVGGCLLVFIPAVGEFTIPALLGGADTLMIGRVLWDEFFISRDWPVASAVSIILVLLLVAPIVWFQRVETREQEAAR